MGNSIAEQPLRDRESLYQLERAIIDLIPPINPPATHWLNSDAGLSFCFEHAWERRWQEFPMVGPVSIPRENRFRENELEEIMMDGIDASYDSHSDVAECCEICGCTLSYLLTDHGQDNELEHFASIDFLQTNLDGDLVYQLTRAFMNLDQPGADTCKTAEAINIAERVLIAINTNGESK